MAPGRPRVRPDRTVKFLALLAVLLLEQVRPLRYRGWLYRGYRQYADRLQDRFNAGEFRHGVIAWLLAVVPLVVLVVLVDVALRRVSPLLAMAWSVAVLYVTLGFRHFSHFYTEILRAAGQDDFASARRTLAEWLGEPAAEMSPTEVFRVAIERGLVGAHRHVFGAMAWFIALGPAGAILYRAAEMVATRWGGRPDPESGEFAIFSTRLFRWLDWIPARMTALTFAVVGNFEDAVYCWKSQAASWGERNAGAILAAGAGALGLRLGDTLHRHGRVDFRPELGTGAEPDAEAMEGAIRLVWRALVLWMFLVFIVTLAHALGG